MYVIVRNKNYASMYKMLKDIKFNIQPIYVINKKDHDVKLALMDHGFFRIYNVKDDIIDNNIHEYQYYSKVEHELDIV